MKFEYYNENTDITSESIEKLKTEIVKMDNELRNAVKELALRGEKLEEMEGKAQHLESSSNTYKQGAIKVRKKTIGSKICICFGILIDLIIIVLLILVLVCGWKFQCKK